MTARPGAYFAVTESPYAVAPLVVKVEAAFQRQVPEALAVTVVRSLPAESVVTVLTVVYVEVPDRLNWRATERPACGV